MIALSRVCAEQNRSGSFGILVNDLVKLVKYLRFKNRTNETLKRGEFIGHDDDDDDELNSKKRFVANKNYDQRFRLIEASLFKSYFVQNKKASRQEICLEFESKN